MTKQQFSKFIKDKITILDGATGSNLINRGMPIGVCPEQWILENKEVLCLLQREFIEAGTNILYAPTFTSNRIKLGEYGLEERLDSMNQELVSISKRAVELENLTGSVLIAGDMTMTGEQLYPMGTLRLEELIDVYKEQVKSLVKAGVDLIVVETMMSLQECRAAVLAVKETCDLPIMVTLTFNEDMRTLYGTDPETAATVMEALGVDAVGVNCSTGPEKMCEVLRRMKEYATIPLIGKPNAGLPRLESGQTIYDMGPEEFGIECQKLVEAGATIVGGCCGTTPEHIRQLKKQVQEMPLPVRNTCKRRLLTTERKTLEILLDGNFMVVGERINPTGKKALQEELRLGKLDLVVKMAEEQEEQGASILDVNMGMNGINENEMMQKVIYELMNVTSLPLCIDSSHIPVIEQALRVYPGRALINSISMESEKFEKLIPIAKKYGAMFVLLPLSDEGLPRDMEEKKEIIHKILERAESFGLTREDMIVDGLVATVGANKRAAIETMETISYCKNVLGVATICGLSNISFGLPERQFVNSTFLAFAIKEGLTMAIANPSQDLLMNIAFASDLLLDKAESAVRYIDRVSGHPLEISGKKQEPANKGVDNSGSSGKEKYTVKAEMSSKEVEKNLKEEHKVYQDVLKGNRRNILEDVKECVSQGETPSEIMDRYLIPAINQTGVLFDKQVYFLPQLIASAETMKVAIDYLEPLMQKDGPRKKLATVVMATVKGDIMILVRIWWFLC